MQFWSTLGFSRSALVADWSL